MNPDKFYGRKTAKPRLQRQDSARILQGTGSSKRKLAWCFLLMMSAVTLVTSMVLVYFTYEVFYFNPIMDK